MLLVPKKPEGFLSKVSSDLILAPVDICPQGPESANIIVSSKSSNTQNCNKKYIVVSVMF